MLQSKMADLLQKDLLIVTMIQIAQAIVHASGGGGFIPWLPVLAQEQSPPPANSSPLPGLPPGVNDNLFSLITNLVGALAILLLGWLIASLVAAAFRGLLKRTQLDNRVASWTMGQQRADNLDVEGWGSTIVFWIVMILAIVAALNVLNLTVVSQPLNNFLNQIFAYLPRLGSAAILIAIAWLLATIVKFVVIRLSRSFALDERLSQQTDGTAASQDRFLVSDTLGNVLYWFIFLFFLPLILDVLGLQGPLQPVQNLLNDLLAALPRILKAIIIGAVGWLIARIVRGIVTNLLAAAGTDRIGARVGLSNRRGQSLSWVLGTIVYVLILIPTVIAALQALDLQAVSVPASQMLNQILSAIPQIFAAALILAIAFVIGRFISDLITNLLTGLGFNNVLSWLGLESVSTSRPTPTPPSPSIYPPPPTLEDEESFSTMTPVPPAARTPSEIAGVIVLVGIMLFAAVAATNVLGFAALTAIVSGLLVILGQILVGVVVFAIGLYLANLAYSLISSSGSGQALIVAQAARIGILVLVAAMALQQIGIAPNIVNLAFGLLFGAIAVAIALAFGLGGRDVAADQLREWLSSFKQRR